MQNNKMYRFSWSLRGLIFFICLLIFHPENVAAQLNEPKIDIIAGFDGYYKEKHWLPLTVILENNGASLEGTLHIEFDNYIQQDVIYQYPLLLPSVSRKQVRLAIYPELSFRAIQVSLQVDRKVVAKAETTLRSMSVSDPLIGIVAASPSSYSQLSELDSFAELSGSAAVAQLTLEQLPDNSATFDALNVLVLSNTDTQEITDAQLQALKQWVAAGGRLFITGGPSWQQTASGLLDSGLLPIQPDNDLVVPDLHPLEILANSELALDEDAQTTIVSTGKIAQGAAVFAALQTSSADIPLVAHQPYGSGAVFYLAFDPALPPFSDWGGAVDLYRHLLETPINQPVWAHGFTDWWTAASAAQSMPGVRLPSFLLICGLLVVYIAVMGPLNFLLLRLLKRRELGWFSLPVSVVFFSMLVFLAGTFLRSGGPILNRLSIIQVWPDEKVSRVNSLISLYSPNRSTYTLTTTGSNLIHRIPNDPPTPAEELTIWQNGESIQLQGLNMDSGSLASVAMESGTPAIPLTTELTLSLNEIQATLDGKVSNLSDILLQIAVIHTPAGAYQLGDLDPGETVDIAYSINAGPAIGPLPPTSIVPMSPYVISKGFGTDQFINDALGTTNYYDDQEIYQRYQLLLAALGGYSAPMNGVSGVYLTAWSDSSPVQVELLNKSSRSQDLSLYIVNLKFDFSARGTNLTIPPGLFSRRVLDSTLYYAPPYYVYSGQRMSFEDTPLVDLEFSSVEELQLHLDGGTGTGAASEITISLWNHAENVWEIQEDLVWGDNIISAPEPYVSELGAVRLLLEGTSAQGVNINSLGFSLQVER